MVEDFPLDPEQVQPPQEEQAQRDEATHIEVAHHDEGQAPEKVADDHDESAPKEEQEGPNYIHDKDKAEVMAHAQNDTLDANDGKTLEEWRAGRYSKDHKKRWTSPEHAAEEAGNEYDLDHALNERGFSQVRTPEEARASALVNRGAFIDCSNAIAENYKKYGDKLSLTLEALESVHELVKGVGYNEFATSREGSLDPNRVKVELDETRGGAVVVTKGLYYGEPSEQWRLPMFGNGEYTITQVSGDPEGDFRSVETKKTRELGENDVAALDKALRPAIEHKEREDKFRHEANDGYEEDDDTEDLLAGDVDRVVHPDETRTDEQIERDRKFQVEPY